jgi:hypothetical protein
LSRL